MIDTIQTPSSRLLRAVLLVLFVVASMASATQAQWQNRLSFEEGEEGWMMLFYGKDLEGWEAHGLASWSVEDGAIVGTGEAGFLVTEEEYGDFEVKLEFLAEPGANSGVFVRTTPLPKNVLEDCYEINIAPLDNPFPTGSIVGRQKATEVAEIDDWQTLHIEVFREEIIVRVDGVKVLEFHDPEPIKRGRLSLQHRVGEIRFRNLKLRYLDM